MPLEIRPEPMRATDQDTNINASIAWKWNGGKQWGVPHLLTALCVLLLVYYFTLDKSGEKTFTRQQVGR